MKKRWMRRMSSAACTLLLLAMTGQQAKAYSEEEEYITISVDAADESGLITYALDTDDPEAFGSESEFSVLADGSSHIIYVKDEAGNITSQVFEGEAVLELEETDTVTETEEIETITEEVILTDGGGEIYLDVELGMEEAETYDYLTDTPAEIGEGTVHSRVETLPDEDASRIFYSITTKEGEVFYLVIDKTQSTENVYLLDQVKLSDLEALAEEDGESPKETKESAGIIFPQEETVLEEESKKGGIPGGNILLLLALAAAGAFLYYHKVYKKKREETMDLMDARDLDEFSPEEEEEEALFETEEEEQDELLYGFMEEDASLLDADPEEWDGENNMTDNPEEQDGREDEDTSLLNLDLEQWSGEDGMVDDAEE